MFSGKNTLQGNHYVLTSRECSINIKVERYFVSQKYPLVWYYSINACMRETCVHRRTGPFPWGGGAQFVWPKFRILARKSNMFGPRRGRVWEGVSHGGDFFWIWGH